MAIEKMHFVNIAGPINSIDTFVINSIIPYNVQLVSAFSILDSVKGLHSFTDPNPYTPLVKKMEELFTKLEMVNKDDIKTTNDGICLYNIEDEIKSFNYKIEQLSDKKEDLVNEIKKKKQIRKQIIPIKNIDFEIDKLFHLEHMKFRFGEMPKDSYKKLEHYVENLEVIVLKVFEEEDKVFLIYFMPRMVKENIDSLFASLYFTRIRLSDEIKGYPNETLIHIDNDIRDLQKKLVEVENKINIFYQENNDRLSELYQLLNRLDQVFDVRRYAVHSREAFYLTGWIPESKLSSFMEAVKNSRGVTCIVEDDDVVKKITPPTRLSNWKFFKPFEEIVSMYGTPSYNEIDPTTFVGVTYLLMFGMMFGDVGQGLVIALLSYIVYKKKKIVLAKLGIYLGFCSAFFGIFYGSIFGNEELLRNHLHFIPMINPMESKMTLLGAAVAFGVILILSAMVINIINLSKNKNYGKLLFDRNGIAGLVFYLALLYFAMAKLIKLDITLWVVVLLIILPLILIFLAHPLENLIKHKKHILPEDKTGFFIESFFELVETILAILSNTISFMRVGAFALNHVGFFLAFHMLADMVGGAGSTIVMIFGNILIICLEGLIVAIQGLRLEYYELFSRFFKGEGIQFKPFIID
jgi:V/A-type H+-transporting ATPase subunit I